MESQSDKKRSHKILEEQDYVEMIENIIERDFFPDLTELKSQQDYIEALETNDVAKLRHLISKYGRAYLTKSLQQFETPSTFETPLESLIQSPKFSNGRNPSPPKDHNEDELPNLTKFLSQNTSEDNASFTEIAALVEKRHRQKYAWMYEAGAKSEMLALEQSSSDKKSQPETWKFVVKNALMFDVDGVEDVAPKSRKTMEVCHKNTRFPAHPFNYNKEREKLKLIAEQTMLMKKGKVGADGKELVETPNKRGYQFVATPSPMPGVSDSPLMTWGVVEGTPAHIDEPKSTPTFKIPDVPLRDRLGLQLAEKAAQQHRLKKHKAVSHIRSQLTSPNSLSPAATRLLKSQRRSDTYLRHSYSPSPRRTPRATPSPNLTASLLPLKASSSKITPQRSKAVDFF